MITVLFYGLFAVFFWYCAYLYMPVRRFRYYKMQLFPLKPDFRSQDAVRTGSVKRLRYDAATERWQLLDTGFVRVFGLKVMLLLWKPFVVTDWQREHDRLQ